VFASQIGDLVVPGQDGEADLRALGVDGGKNTLL